MISRVVVIKHDFLRPSPHSFDIHVVKRWNSSSNGVSPNQFNQFSENWSGSSHGFAWFLHILYLDMLEDQFQIFFKKFPELFFLWIFSQRTPWIFWKTSSINTNIRIFFISFIIKENYLELILSKSTPNIL